MSAKLFEAALGIAAPWSVKSVEFDEGARVLTVLVDFEPGTHFAIAGHEGTHPVHDTVAKTYRHLNFFQHECVLEVRTPRVKLPDGSVHLVKPPFAGKLSGFTLLFEALVLMLARQMPFAAAARIVGLSPYRVLAICRRYVALALQAADFRARSRRWPSTRPRAPAAATTSRWRRTPSSVGSWPWPKGARPRPLPPSPPS